jgi:hypothetical protein
LTHPAANAAAVPAAVGTHTILPIDMTGLTRQLSAEGLHSMRGFIDRLFGIAPPAKPTNLGDAGKIEAIIASVVPAYGEIIEKWPLIIFPASRLPLPKGEMKTALRLAWRIRKEPKLRESIEIAFVHLCQFREDVSTPIDPTVPKDATPQQAVAILDPFLTIAKQVEAERAKLAVEFAEYRAFMEAQGR